MPAPLFNPHALTLDASRRWVGYAALVRGLGLSAPVAAECAVANGHIRGSVRREDGVRIFDQRYRPTDDVGGHLHFALKHEALIHDDRFVAKGLRGQGVFLGDLYRYGDYTPLAEFLYACVAHTVTELLPQEVRYLQCHDRALTALAQHIDLPQNLARDLIMFVTQNDMKLPIRRRKGEFASLTDDEIEVLETEIARAFNDTSDAAVGRLA